MSSKLLREIFDTNSPHLILGVHPLLWDDEQTTLLKCRDVKKSPIPMGIPVAQGVTISPEDVGDALREYNSLIELYWPSWGSVRGNNLLQFLVEALETHEPNTNHVLPVFSLSRKINSVKFSYGIRDEDKVTLQYSFSVQFITRAQPNVAFLDTNMYRLSRMERGGKDHEGPWEEDDSLHAYCVAILIGLAQEFAANNHESNSTGLRAGQMVHLVVLSNLDFGAILYTAIVKDRFLRKLNGSYLFNKGQIKIKKQKASMDSLWGMIYLLKQVWNTSTPPTAGANISTNPNLIQSNTNAVTGPSATLPITGANISTNPNLIQSHTNAVTGPSANTSATNHATPGDDSSPATAANQ